ncbi:MAG: LPXTG cell wall anchor domain-containing protein, partial [Clostridia bacterium]|nr:LPXTG cell wall anchor domain-containing protein [Clostridia bacterium]
LESSKTSPKGGSFAQEILDSNPNLTKALYYGYGGPEDLSASFFPDYSANVRYILTHIAASYFFTGSYSSATKGCTSSGLKKYRVQEWIDYIAGLEDPPSPGISLSDKSLEVTGITGGVQTTYSTTLNADHRNTITLALPDNVTYHNDSTGETQTGGTVTIGGGTTFHFSAPTSVSGTWKTGDMKGMIAMIWKVLVVKTGTKTQKLGSYASEEYGGSVHFTVTWKSEVTLNIVKADAANTNVHLAGAVIGVYSDADCTNQLTTMTTGADGSASCTIPREYVRLYLKELQAPTGYRLSKTVYTVDMPDGDSVTAMVKDEQQTAGLKITKRGEVLTGADVTDAGVRFNYETRKLSGAVYRVTAESAIYTPDGALMYQKGDVVADGLTTNDSGEVMLNNVPLGSYIVEETQAPAGFVLSGEKHTVKLEYAGQDAEVAFNETTFTNERQKAAVTIHKQDGETKNPLAGGTFALYAASAITSYKGDNLVSAGTLIETVVTGADGSAAFAADLPVGFKYEVKEVAPPAGYTFGVDKYEFAFNASAQTQAVSEFGYTFSNDRITATLNLHKKDAGTGFEQGNAQLAGAVYALYAREAIVHPDGKTGTLYEKDALVTTMTTDAAGDAKAENLPLGKYYLKEITPSAGYLLDANVYEVDCTKYDPSKYLILVEATVKEQVIKQPFQVIKAANNGKTDADLIKDAGFTAWLVSDLMKNADGSYDFSSAEPVALGANGETEIFTDEKGHATSVPLPFGTYIVRETTTPKNYAPVDDFIVTIKENNPTKPQVWRVLLDEEFAAKLKIYKVDSATGRTILLPGAEFSIYDVDNDTFVEQVTTYPQTVKHTTFTTDESGTLTLPETLRPGHYRITEINAPFGYTLNRAEADVTISSETLHQVDAVSGDLVIEVTMRDAPARGRITVYKEGEMLSRFENGQFIYEVQRLPGATFEVVAAEDIYTADNQRDADGNRYLEYAAGTVVATLTTDENGEARTEDLPLGTYKVGEKKAPTGFVLNAEPVTVTLEYADQETEIVVEAVTVADARQKVSLVVEKKAKDKDIKLPGATMGLYAGEDIRAHDAVIVPAGTCLATAVSDETGSVAFDIDLPLGKYLVNELKAPVGYVLSDEVIELEAAYQGQDVKVVSVTGTYENQPTRVVISKADATTGVELDGAKLTLLDASGKEIDSWTSVAGEPHLIEGLAIGATYTLREDIAPYGYLISNSVKFTVGDTAEIQKVIMKDEVPTGKIIINKSGEFLSDVSVLDSATGWIGNTFSFITGGLKDVTFGVYAYDDIKQADGVSPDYYAAGTQIGTITTDNTGVAIMENLPLGRYMVKEIATQNGYVLDDQPRLIDLTYRDSKTPVVTYSEAWQNERQRARVTVVKKEKDGDRLLEGAVFGLYSAEDIIGENGKVILAKDTLIEQRATDSNGSLTFEVDLPVGFDYAVKEITPPAGYASDPNAQTFTFDGSNTDVAVVEMEYTFEDMPTLVDVTKSSLTTGEELEGASLQVTDEDGNVIDSWISEKEPHRIIGLVVGKTYTLTETLPASGYATAESIKLTISDTGDVQPVEMKDDVTKVKISKTDLTGKKELEGAKLTILDSEGKVVETWTSTTEPHYIEMLPIGKYTLREETAPSGYLIAEDVEFEVKDTAELQTVTMKDAEENPAQPGTPMPDTPKTGDMNNPLLLGGIGAVALLGLMTAVLVMRKNRRKF